MTTAEQIAMYRQAADHYAEKASELAEFLDLPSPYFSPRGAEHWYQVTSRSEVEEHMASYTKVAAYFEAKAAGVTA